MDLEHIQDCALHWLRDANALLCSYVMNPAPGPNDDLDDYYEGAVPIIQEQIAKGGVRLAVLFNSIYTGQTGFPPSTHSKPLFYIQEHQHCVH